MGLTWGNALYIKRGNALRHNALQFSHGRAEGRTRAIVGGGAMAAEGKGFALKGQWRSMRQLFSLPVISIGVAFGCALVWVMMVFQSLGIFHDFPHGESIMDSIYLISIVATACTLALIALFHRQVRSILGTNLMRVAIPATLAGSTLLMYAAGAPAPLGGVAIGLSGILSGVSSAFFLMYFGVTLSLLPLKESIVAVATGYGLSTVAFSLYLFFSPFEAAVCAATTAPLGAMFLYYGVRTLGLHKQQEQDPLPPQQLPENPSERLVLRRLTLAFALCMFVAGIAYELSRTLYVQMGSFPSAEVGGYALAQAVVTTIVSLGSMVLALALASAKSSWGPQVCYRLTVFFLLLGVLLLPAPLIFPRLSALLPLAINNASFLCLNMMMWVLVAGTCRRFFTTCLRTFALIRCAWSAGPLCGMLIGRWILAEGHVTVPALFGAALVCAMLLLLMESFVFTERTLGETLELMPRAQQGHFQECCRRVAKRYGLTERECEVMVLFAKGRTLPYIQKELYLSKSTVSTHRQHIYQKLGVHTSQEMIDLIQQEKA